MAEGLVVVTKLGVMAAEPYGLYDRLAEQHVAAQHVPHDIHIDLFGCHDRQDAHRSKIVFQEMLNRTEASLKDGFSVVFDRFMNSPRRLDQLTALTKNLGATAVLVHPTAPDMVILARVAERYHANTLSVPSAETSLAEQFTVARDMIAYVKRGGINPDISANLVHHLCVDGTLSVPEIIEAEQAYVRELQGQTATASSSA